VNAEGLRRVSGRASSAARGGRAGPATPVCSHGDVFSLPRGVGAPFAEPGE
jgi:hypothetical protein